MSKTDINVNLTYYTVSHQTEDSTNGAGVANPSIDIYRREVDYYLKEVRTGGVTPNFRKLSQAGSFIPPNAFFYKKTKSSPVHYNLFQLRLGSGGYNGNANYYKGTLYNNIGSMSSLIQPLSTLTPELYAAADGRARNKILGKIKDSPVELGVAIGERKQTVDLFVTTAKRVVEVVKNLKKGNLVGAANAIGVGVSKRKSRAYGAAHQSASSGRAQLDNVSRGWLELQYGWKPLLSDVFGAAEMLARSHENPRPKRVVARDTVRRDLTREIRIDSTTKGYIKGDLSVETTYTVYFAPVPGVPLDLKQWGLTNPLSIAWELVPFSFVADWFLPVGNFLNGFDATVGTVFRAGCKTVCIKYSYESSQFQRLNKSNSIYDLMETFSYAQEDLVQVTRSVMTGYPSPALPSFKNPVSRDHVLNAIALLNLNLKRK